MEEERGLALFLEVGHFFWASFLPSPLVPGIAASLIPLSFLSATSNACCVTLPPLTSPTSVLAKSFLLRLSCM